MAGCFGCFAFLRPLPGPLDGPPPPPLRQVVEGFTLTNEATSMWRPPAKVETPSVPAPISAIPEPTQDLTMEVQSIDLQRLSKAMACIERYTGLREAAGTEENWASFPETPSPKKLLPKVKEASDKTMDTPSTVSPKGTASPLEKPTEAPRKAEKEILPASMFEKLSAQPMAVQTPKKLLPKVKEASEKTMDTPSTVSPKGTASPLEKPTEAPRKTAKGILTADMFEKWSAERLPADFLDSRTARRRWDAWAEQALAKEAAQPGSVLVPHHSKATWKDYVWDLDVGDDIELEGIWIPVRPGVKLQILLGDSALGCLEYKVGQDLDAVCLGFVKAKGLRELFAPLVAQHIQTLIASGTTEAAVDVVELL
ncbi:unnamed protein product [Effrenium voratum]|uniref:Uncharacterized protein n=1 Tax=Effrenium voratum TaxID=2562239 RepID=A0AA36J2V3_9DINO|nr:unnamed protein product [Effrenium voratum]CAJ1451335.1 unnamed protein product [Effrenium voratum]